MKVIVEIAKTHGGDINFAKECIKNVANSGLKAVKFQAYDLKDLNKKHPNYERNKEAHLTIEQLAELAQYAWNLDLDFYCSAFSESVLPDLACISKEKIKVPSTFLTNTGFIRKCELLFDKVHLSTGMHTIEQVGSAIVKLIYPGSAVIYNCVSEYPCASPGLERIKTFKRFIEGPVGLSYHGRDISVITAAFFAGYEYLEIHYSDWMMQLSGLYSVNRAVMDAKVLNFYSGVSKKEEENFEFYRTEYKGLMKNVKSRLSSK